MASFAFKERSSDLNLSVDFFCTGKSKQICKNCSKLQRARVGAARKGQNITRGAFCFAAFKGPLLFFVRIMLLWVPKNCSGALCYFMRYRKIICSKYLIFVCSKFFSVNAKGRWYRKVFLVLCFGQTAGQWKRVHHGKKFFLIFAGGVNGCLDFFDLWNLEGMVQFLAFRKLDQFCRKGIDSK